MLTDFTRSLCLKNVLVPNFLLAIPIFAYIFLSGNLFGTKFAFAVLRFSTLSVAFWREPFESLCQPKQLTEFYVVDVEPIENLERKAGHGFVSKKHQLADVWLQRSCEVGI